MRLVNKIFNYLSTKDNNRWHQPALLNSFAHEPSHNNPFANKISYAYPRGGHCGHFDVYIKDDSLDAHHNILSANIEDAQYCAVDVETTGFNEKTDRITEISVIKLSGDKVTSHIERLVNPQRSIPYKVSSITGIYDDMLVDKQVFGEISDEIIEFIGSSVIIAHHSDFDTRFINSELIRAGKQPLKNFVLCTCKLTRAFYPFMSSYSLDSVADLFNLKFVSRHRAYGDALMVANIFHNFLPLFPNYSIYTLKDLLKYSR